MTNSQDNYTNDPRVIIERFAKAGRVPSVLPDRLQKEVDTTATIMASVTPCTTCNKPTIMSTMCADCRQEETRKKNRKGESI